MNELLVITAVGEDRPGIVDELTRIIFDADLNIEDSRMTVLGGEFAIILLISGGAQALEKIQAEQTELEQALRLNLLIKPTRARQPVANKIPYSIKVIGMDHPGIVHRLARFLSEHNINIENLETDSYPAPHTGTTMFAVEIIAEIPGDISIGKFRNEFAELCDQQNLDVDFSAIKQNK